MQANVVRIFISSPADVGYERARAERVAERLSGLIDGLTVETYRWEKDRYFSAHDSFQPQILPVDTFDIIVGLFWSRVGSALPPSFPKMPDGRPYPSGTAYEVLRAIEHRRDSGAPLPDVLVYRKTAPIPISVEKEEERSQQSAALNTLDAFMDEYFVNPQEGFKAAFQSFRDADEFERLFEMHLRAWLRENRRLGRERVWRVEEKGSPFRGLKPFEFEHRDAFFGRRADVERGRERLYDAAASGCSFLLIEGASGAGKSSMARAGLLPRLKDLDPDLRLAIVTAGVDPVETLSTVLFSSAALPELADGDFDTPQALAQHLAEGGGITPILRALERGAAAMAERDDRKEIPALRLALLIDQLESVFTGSVDTLARQRFCETLVSLVRSDQVLVIATLRADGRASALAEPSLAALIDQGAGLALAPPGPEALAEIVCCPAQAAGLVFARRPEDGLGLDEILIQDAGGTDALPLLQFVLEGLYEAAIARVRASGRALGDVEPEEPVAVLDIADYRGLADAVEAKAEEVFAKLLAAAQAGLPRLVRALTEPGPGGTAVLCSATLDEAAPGPESQVLAAALVDARILVRDDTLLRFSHETALRGWRRAANAAAEAANFLRVRSDLLQGEARWRDQGRRRDMLLPSGLRLAEAELAVRHYADELSASVHSYVTASGRNARLRQRITMAAALLFAALATAAWWFAFQAEQQRHNASQNAATAERAAIRALGNQRNALAALALNQVESDPINAMRLILASWPEDNEEPFPNLSLAFEVLSRASALTEAHTAVAAHNGGVLAISKSPDGQSFVTGGADKILRFWKVGSGTPSGDTLQTDNTVRKIAYSSDGTRLAAGGNNGSLKLWNAVDGTEIDADFDGYRGIYKNEEGGFDAREAVTELAFSPDGQSLLAGSVPSGFLQYSLNGTKIDAVHLLRDNLFDNSVGILRGIGISRDGRKLAFSNHFGRIRTWSTSMGLGNPFEGGTTVGYVDRNGSELEFSESGALLATGDDRGSIRIWDVTTDEIVWDEVEQHKAPITAIAISGSDRFAVSGDSSGTLQFWEINSQRRYVEALHGHEGAIRSALFSRDGRTIITGDIEGTLRLWRAPVPVVLSQAVMPNEFIFDDVTFTPDGNRIIAKGAGSEELWDIDAARLLGRVDFGSGIFDRAAVSKFSPDGRTLAIGQRDGTIELVLSETREALRKPLKAHDTSITEIAFSTDGRRIATVSEIGEVTIWDTSSGESVHRLMFGRKESVDRILFSPDGSRLATVGGGRVLRLWNLDTGAEISLPLDAADAAVNSIAFSPSGGVLVAGGLDGVLRQWDPMDGSTLGPPVATFEDRRIADGGRLGHPNTMVTSLAISADGQYAIAKTKRGSGIWNLSSGASLHESLVGWGDEQALSIAFSPDGDRIAVGRADGTLQLWDIATRYPLGRRMRSRDPITSVAFSRDGSRIVTGGQDRTLLVWNNPPHGNLLQVACKLIPKIDGQITNESMGLRIDIDLTDLSLPTDCENFNPPLHK